MGRRPGIAGLLGQIHDPADRFVTAGPHGVGHVAALPRFGSPTDDLVVKGLGGGLVRGHQVVPHKSSVRWMGHEILLGFLSPVSIRSFGAPGSLHSTANRSGDRIHSAGRHFELPVRTPSRRSPPVRRASADAAELKGPIGSGRRTAILVFALSRFGDSSTIVRRLALQESTGIRGSATP